MFGRMANDAMAKVGQTTSKIGEAVDNSLRPHEEAYVGTVLPGGRGITDHGGTNTGSVTVADPIETDWDSIGDEVLEVPAIVDPVPVRIVSGKGRDRKLFRTDRFGLSADPIQVGTHPSRDRITLICDSDWQLCHQQNMFGAFQVSAGSTMTIVSTEAIYVTGSGTLSVLEEYTVKIVE